MRRPHPALWTLTLLLGAVPAVFAGTDRASAPAATAAAPAAAAAPRTPARQPYLSAAASYFGRTPEQMGELARRYGTRDDLAVTLFVASKAARSPEEIHQLRLRGLFWWEISTMHDLSGDVWFTKAEAEQPEPEYERSYRQLENWRRGRTRHLELTDDEVRDLIAVRVVHDVMNVPVKRAMKLRSSGKDLAQMLDEEQRLRQHGGEAVEPDRAPGSRNPAKGER
jgi:hypothetical protein